MSFQSGHREVVAMDRMTPALATHRITLARALRLTLNNGQNTFVLIESFDLGLLEQAEDSAQLHELARDSAGVNSALRTLEAIAAEGSRWIEQERRRRERRLRSYQERHARSLAIGAARDIPVARSAIQGRVSMSEI